MLKTYQTCPKKFYFQYVERINIPRFSTPFEKGKKIHALANYYLQGINISRIEGALNTSERQAWEALQKNPFFLKKCYKSANKEYVEYVIQDYQKPMGVATYSTSADMPERLRNALPDIEDLKKLL